MVTIYHGQMTIQCSYAFFPSPLNDKYKIATLFGQIDLTGAFSLTTTRYMWNSALTKLESSEIT